MKTTLFGAAVAGALLIVTSVHGAAPQAQYPTKPIRFVVPSLPGGGTDILGRLITAKLTEKLGWQFVVDNKPGVGGNIGADVVAKAAPDGYTLVIGQTSNLAINPTLYRKIPYDPIRDFAPITLVSDIPIVIAVAAKSPYQRLTDLLAAAKAKPGELVFGSPGSGTVSHLAEVLLERTTGARFIHVPYKGVAQGMPDLIAGRINFYMGSTESLVPQVKAGNIRALAVTSAKRTPSLPEVPAVAELGYKDFEASTWFGILAPAHTPDALISRLNAEITRVLQMPDVRERMADGGGDIKTGPRYFAEVLKNDYAKWARIVKESGAKAD